MVLTAMFLINLWLYAQCRPLVQIFLLAFFGSYCILAFSISNGILQTNKIYKPLHDKKDNPVSKFGSTFIVIVSAVFITVAFVDIFTLPSGFSTMCPCTISLITSSTGYRLSPLLYVPATDLQQLQFVLFRKAFRCCVAVLVLLLAAMLIVLEKTWELI